MPKSIKLADSDETFNAADRVGSLRTNSNSSYRVGTLKGAQEAFNAENKDKPTFAQDQAGRQQFLNYLKEELEDKNQQLESLLEQEGQCLSALAEEQKKHDSIPGIGRFSMYYEEESEIQEGSAVSEENDNQGPNSTLRSRAVSGTYGFEPKIAKPNVSLSEMSEDGPDEVLWTAADGDLAPMDEKIESGSDTEAPSSGPHVYSLLGTGISAQPREPRSGLRQRLLTMKPAAERPSESIEKRLVRVVRKTPGEPLGMTLKTAMIPKKDENGQVKSNEMSECTFVETVNVEKTGYKSGLRVGDQILEIDGEACVDAKHSFVVRLLQKNEGTIQLVVKYTSDFRRMELHKKMEDLNNKLRGKLSELKDIEGEEIKTLDEIAFIGRQPSSPEPRDSADDLCKEDIMASWTGSQEDLITAMITQWKAERQEWLLEKKALNAKVAALRVSGVSGGSTSSSVLQRTSVVGGRVILNLDRVDKTEKDPAGTNSATQLENEKGINPSSKDSNEAKDSNDAKESDIGKVTEIETGDLPPMPTSPPPLLQEDVNTASEEEDSDNDKWA
eukprot:m.4325 g.4325  ORF g.4325 m.4325 type:complete len:558 (+) comp2956_c0_seq1:101-1774(+)